jgi:hypothetical protein
MPIVMRNVLPHKYSQCSKFLPCCNNPLLNCIFKTQLIFKVFHRMSFCFTQLSGIELFQGHRHTIFVVNSWTRTHGRGGTVIHHQQQSTTNYNP